MPPGRIIGDMSTRALLLRLAFVATLVLGLVGMHHLVVVACHHAASSTTSTAAPLALDAHHSGSHAAGHGLPAPAPADEPPGAPTGLLGAAATCLAIILMLVLLVAPRFMSRLRRVLVPDRLPAPRHVVARLLEPPDLHRLSVSRT